MFCTKCQRERVKEESPSSLRKGVRRFTDEYGRVWKSKSVCPACMHGREIPKHSKEHRAKLSEQRRGINTKLKRLCRFCNKTLPPSRYFNHVWCRNPEYYDIFSDYGYHL